MQFRLNVFQLTFKKIKTSIYQETNSRIKFVTSYFLKLGIHLLASMYSLNCQKLNSLTENWQFQGRVTKKCAEKTLALSLLFNHFLIYYIVGQLH